MLTAEKIACSEAVIESLESQVQMLSNPRITLNPLEYINMQLNIERNNLERLKNTYR